MVFTTALSANCWIQLVSRSTKHCALVWGLLSFVLVHLEAFVLAKNSPRRIGTPTSIVDLGVRDSFDGPGILIHYSLSIKHLLSYSDRQDVVDSHKKKVKYFSIPKVTRCGALAAGPCGGSQPPNSLPPTSFLQRLSEGHCTMSLPIPITIITGFLGKENQLNMNRVKS